MPRFLPRNYHAKEWIELAYRIRQREHHQCEVCGEEDTRNAVDHDYYKLYGELWDVPEEYLHLLCDFDHRRTEEERQELRRALGGRDGATWMQIQMLVRAIDQARTLGHSPQNIIEHCVYALTADSEYLAAMDREIKKFLIRRANPKPKPSHDNLSNRELAGNL